MASGGVQGGCGHWAGCDQDQEQSFSEPFFHGQRTREDGEGFAWSPSWQAVPEATTTRKPLLDEQVASSRAMEASSSCVLSSVRPPSHLWQVASRARWTLQRLGEARENGTDGSQRFFVAVGFSKPHLPFVFPERFLELYPEHAVKLPRNPNPPRSMPRIAWSNNAETRFYKDTKALNNSGYPGQSRFPDAVTLALRRAYYAAVSFADANVGVVVDALKEAPGQLWGSTIVCFWSGARPPGLRPPRTRHAL